MRFSTRRWSVLALCVVALGCGGPVGPSNPDAGNNDPPATVVAPGAPTSVVATAGVRSADVTWAAPASNGGAAITGYRITASPGGVTATVTGTSGQVTGLENGKSYSFTVSATNSAGRSPESAASAAITTPDVASAPQGLVAVAFDGKVDVRWQAPESTGGRPVTGYTVQASPGDVVQTVAANVQQATFADLTNDTGYTFTVTAQNAVGSSAASPAIEATPRAPVTNSAPIGQAGGTLTSSTGLTLTVPAGALDDQAAALSVTATGVQPPVEMQPVSQVFSFGPDGTVFAHPVKVSLPLPPGVTQADLYWSRKLSDGSIVFDNVGGTVVDGMLVAEVVHFSEGFAGAPATTRTVSGSRVTTYVSTARADNNRSTDFSTVPIAAQVELADGGVTELAGSGRSDGTFSIPGVPDGEYWVRVGNVGDALAPQYLRTSANVIDLGSVQYGRPDAVSAAPGTVLQLEVDGMTPWDPANHAFEVVATDADPNNGYFVGDPVGGYCEEQRLDAGTTTLSYALSATNPCYSGIAQALIQGTRGDRAMVAQLGTHTSDAGVAYLSMERVFEPEPFDMAQGQTTVLRGSFQAVPADRSVSFDVRTEAFHPHLYVLDEAGSPIESSLTPTGGDHTRTEARAFVGVLAYGAPRMESVSAASADPLQVYFWAKQATFVTGGLDYAVPNEAHWTSVGEYRFQSLATYRHPEAANMRFVRNTGMSGSMSIPALAAGPILPQLSPVRALLLDGQDAMVDRTAASTRPVLSWTAPAVGTPGLYRVSVRRLGVNTDSGDTTSTQVASLATRDTSVRLPPGLLVSGNHYFFAVFALQTAYPDPVRAPYRTRLPEYSSSVLSGMVTVP